MLLGMLDLAHSKIKDMGKCPKSTGLRHNLNLINKFIQLGKKYY